MADKDCNIYYGYQVITNCVVFLAKFQTWLNQEMAQFRNQTVLLLHRHKIHQSNCSNFIFRSTKTVISRTKSAFRVRHKLNAFTILSKSAWKSMKISSKVLICWRKLQHQIEWSVRIRVKTSSKSIQNWNRCEVSNFCLIICGFSRFFINLMSVLRTYYKF
jgi:hypothetical protein